MRIEGGQRLGLPAPARAVPPPHPGRRRRRPPLARPLEQRFQLRLTPPRGLFDAFTVPLLPAFRRQAGTETPGQLVAVVGPKGTVATAGIRRGDVITAVDGRSVATPGGWSVAMRALAAEKPADGRPPPQGGRRCRCRSRPKPDWTKAPDYEKSLAVAVRREPATMAYSVAQARQLIDAGKLADAKELIAGWRASWRTSAAGELVQGDLLAKQSRWKQALGAYNRARARDATLSARPSSGAGSPCRGSGTTGPSLTAFAAAARLDPADPAAAGFRAYGLLQEDRVPEAVAAGANRRGASTRATPTPSCRSASPSSRAATRPTASRPSGAGWCCWRSRTGRTA